MSQASFPRHAVVGLDRELRADPAVKAALQLNQAVGTGLTFVHAVDLPEPEDVAGRPDEVQQMESRILQVAEQRSGARLNDLGVPKEGVELVVRRGRPTDVLLAEAGRRQADLIVLGPHQKRGWIDFGRTARAVLAQAPLGVWVQKDEPQDVKRVLVAVDLSEDSLEALRAARTLAAGLGASLTALHVHTPVAFAFGSTPGYEAASMPAYVIEAERDAARGEFEQAMAAQRESGPAFESRFVEGHVVDALLAAQDDHDLLVLGTHGRSRFAAAVLGSVAYTVLKEAHRPVLALRHPERARGLGAG